MHPDYLAPHYANSALLCIDMQNDFVLPQADYAIPGTHEVAPAVALLANHFRTAGRPIYHAVRLYLPDGSNVDACRRALIQSGRQIVAPGSSGAELIDLLNPSGERMDTDRLLSGDFQWLRSGLEAIFYKPRWSAFHETRLHTELQARRIDTLVIAGCNYPNCPRATIYDATSLDYRVVLAKDAVSRLYPQGEEEMRGIGVTLSSFQEIGALLPPALTSPPTQ